MKANVCSGLMVGVLRFIQNTMEDAAHQNPDHLVRFFIDEQLLPNARSHALCRKEHLVANRFYNYLLYRTRYYDDVFTQAVKDGVRQIVILGSGTDTRAYRFRDALVSGRVRTLECDQQATIREKESDAKRLGDCSHVGFSCLDLHGTSPEEWSRRSGYRANLPTLFLAEGLTPYVLEASFLAWLKFFADSSGAGSQLACDYKLFGYDDAFGRVDGKDTMRVPENDDVVEQLHRKLGWHTAAVHRATDLQRMYHPRASSELRPVLEEDVIVFAKRSATAPVAMSSAPLGDDGGPGHLS